MVSFAIRVSHGDGVVDINGWFWQLRVIAAVVADHKAVVRR